MPDPITDAEWLSAFRDPEIGREAIRLWRADPNRGTRAPTSYLPEALGEESKWIIRP